MNFFNDKTFLKRKFIYAYFKDVSKATDKY